MANTSSILIENLSERNTIGSTNRLNAYLCNKRFILISIALVLIGISVTIPMVLLETKKENNQLTTARRSTTEKEFVPLYNLNLTNTTKWRQDGITVLIDYYDREDTMTIDDNDTIYICRYMKNKVIEWKNNFTESRIVAGGNGNGSERNQLSHPTDIFFHRKTHSIIICDYANRRIVQWSLQNTTNGDIVISNIHCFGLAMDDQDYLYVSDDSNYEVRRWNMKTYENIRVAAGNGPGDTFRQIYRQNFIFISKDYSVYLSDTYNNRVIKWSKDAKEGIIVAGGFGSGDDLIQVRRLRRTIIDDLENIYVCNVDNDRIMRWNNGALQGSIVVGGNQKGNKSNQLNFPADFVFDRYNNLYVLDACVTCGLRKFYIASN